MMKLSFRYLTAWVAIGIAASSCQDDIVFHHYKSTPAWGWECNDTVTFHTEPMLQAGIYNETVGLRMMSNYPFMNLCLIVDQTVLPQKTVTRDTLTCQLIDNRGRTNEKGIDHFQYEFPLRQLHLEKGERLHVAIHHIMKRDMIPGITDVGIKISKKEALSKSGDSN